MFLAEVLLRILSVSIFRLSKTLILEMSLQPMDQRQITDKSLQ